MAARADHHRPAPEVDATAVIAGDRVVGNLRAADEGRAVELVAQAAAAVGGCEVGVDRRRRNRHRAAVVVIDPAAGVARSVGEHARRVQIQHAALIEDRATAGDDVAVAELAGDNARAAVIVEETRPKRRKTVQQQGVADEQLGPAVVDVPTQTSPLGPRPNFGGSRIMPSYFTPRFSSRCMYLIASSTIQRMGLSLKPDRAWFSRAQPTDFLDAST